VRDEYSFVIRPLSKEEGSGYLIEYPDLPGRIADGKTPEEAIANGRDAVKSYLFSCRKNGGKVPTPGPPSSGQWRQRVPKSRHSRLAARAKQERVSLNTLVTAMIAEGLGRRG
jgi:antitoxin HicB